MSAVTAPSMYNPECLRFLDYKTCETTALALLELGNKGTPICKKNGHYYFGDFAISEILQTYAKALPIQDNPLYKPDVLTSQIKSSILHLHSQMLVYRSDRANGVAQQSLLSYATSKCVNAFKHSKSLATTGHIEECTRHLLKQMGDLLVQCNQPRPLPPDTQI